MLLIAEHSYSISLNASDMCQLAYHWVLILSCTQVSSILMVKNTECYPLRGTYQVQVLDIKYLGVVNAYRLSDGEGE